HRFAGCGVWTVGILTVRSATRSVLGDDSPARGHRRGHRSRRGAGGGACPPSAYPGEAMTSPQPPTGAPPTGRAPSPVYLDHAATTPVLPAVVDAVAEAMRQGGNASSLHAAGRAARR